MERIIELFPEEVFEKFKAVAENANVIYILYHGDADGVTSGFLINQTLKEAFNKPARRLLWMATNSYDLKKETEEILKSPPDTLIITDIDVKDAAEQIKKLQEHVRQIFVYDHHQISKPPQGSGIFYFNPRTLNPTVWHPASLFGMAIYSYFSLKKNDFLWVGGAGLIGDVAMPEYPWIEEEIKKNFPQLYDSSHPTCQGTAWKYPLEGITYLLNAGFFYYPARRLPFSMLALERAWEKGDPFIFFDKRDQISRKLLAFHRTIEETVKNLSNQALQDAQFHLGAPVISFLARTPHYVVGIVASRLASLYPEKIAVVGQLGERIGIELRAGRNCELNIPAILKLMNFPFLSAGGHPKAAGALIEKNQWEEFIEKFVETAKKAWLMFQLKKKS